MRIIRRKSPLLETIQPAQQASFLARRFRTRGFTFGWHYHPEVELTYIVQGAGLRFVGDSIDSFDDGDLVLLGSNLPHTWQSDEESAGAEAVVIQFSVDLLGNKLAMPELRPIRALIDRAALGLSATDSATRRVVFEAMAKSAAAPAGSMEQLLGLLSALHGMSASSLQLKPLSRQRTDFSSPRAAPRQMKRVHDYLNSAIPAGEFLSQATAAKLVGMSPAAFSRFYRRNAGRTFVGHVNEWRIEFACRALLETDASITGIAFKSGFGNLSNFNRRFKQIKGVTPRTFRKLRGLG